MSVLGPQDEGLEGVVLANRYRIDKRLGAGGMGEVYRATNTVIDRPVAIKVLHRELTRNAEIVERFLREAKAAIIVRHPNVVDVLDVLEHDGVPFIVQELLNGRDLAKYVELSGGALSVDEALPLLIPVIEAVGIANAKGVVHRDLKPENVFLHEVEGQVIPKVLDFGISKLTTADAKRMTSTGTAMGTPAYMSPEQIQGSAGVDPRGDVWSWGVVLFEVLSGRLPFEAETPGALFVQICTTVAPRLDTVISGLPPTLVDIVARCLRPNREERYANSTELARALRAVLAERGVDSTAKLQAIGPAIIEALSSQGALAEPPPATVATPPLQTAKTAVARRPAIAKATEKATPSALAELESNVERELGPPPTQPSKAQPSLVVVGAALMVAGFVGAMGFKALGAGATVRSSADAAVLARVEDSGVPLAERVADAASSALVGEVHVTPDAANSTSDNRSDDAAVLVADNVADAAIDDPLERDSRGGRRHGRHGREPARTVANSNAASASNTASASVGSSANSQGTTSAQPSQGSTITTVSGRTTHAATTYEP
ncbi:MAG: serine/threonine-protein kinase [Polyangiales bacterium]